MCETHNATNKRTIWHVEPTENTKRSNTEIENIPFGYPEPHYKKVWTSSLFSLTVLRRARGAGNLPISLLRQPTIGCKTRNTLQNFGIFLMNVALQLKKISFAKFPPSPQSMLITLSGTMVISCLVNIVQGGGGMFYQVLGYSKTLRDFYVFLSIHQ